MIFATARRARVAGTLGLCWR